MGRVAAEAAKALMGKLSAEYTPHLKPTTAVRIENAAKIHVSDKKRRTKMYQSYSGHPGGLREESFAMLSSRRGVATPIRRAIERMLPRNSFRTARMKLLTISE